MPEGNWGEKISMKIVTKTMTKIAGGFLLFLCAFLSAGRKASAQEPVIVVLDPGHGGENLGGEYETFTEKDMTIVVAEAMKEELEKYDGIKVYMTREDDRDLSLEERVDYAVSVNADFLFCLHFNMSVKHDFFGAEVWVPAFGEGYQKGYTFAAVEMDLLTEKGLYSRGIKTKLNDKGEDYYGILRHSTENNLAAALIEHCHLDQANDQGFYGTEEQLRQFGILDATAVAKYYGLKSERLGVDYSSYQNVEIPLPTAPVKPDKTEPDICMIEVTDADETTGNIKVSVSAQDYDSYILYYSYSYDGGLTFSDLQRWEPGTSDSLSFTMNVPSGVMPDIVVNAYNGFDGITESNHVSIPSMRYGEDEAVAAGSAHVENTPDTVYEEITPGDAGIKEPEKEGQDGKQQKKITLVYFFQVTLICAAILFVLFLLGGILWSGRRRKRRNKNSRKKGSRKK